MLHYQRRGKGPTLVLQHGFLGGSRYFAPQMEHFSASYDVIAADLPGFAGSADQPYPGSVTGLSNALIDLLNSLDIERFSLLGHSLGGAVALQAALDHSQQIEKLVLYGSSSRGNMPNRHETFEETIARFGADGIEKTAARIAKTWFVDGEMAQFYRLCLEAGRGVTLESAIACLKSLPDWNVEARLSELKVPTLVVYGEKDRSFGHEETLALATAISGAEFTVVPGCAHNVHLEEPELFNRIIGDFLSKPSSE